MNLILLIFVGASKWYSGSPGVAPEFLSKLVEGMTGGLKKQHGSTRDDPSSSSAGVMWEAVSQGHILW